MTYSTEQQVLAGSTPTTHETAGGRQQGNGSVVSEDNSMAGLDGPDTTKNTLTISVEGRDALVACAALALYPAYPLRDLERRTTRALLEADVAASYRLVADQWNLAVARAGLNIQVGDSEQRYAQRASLAIEIALDFRSAACLFLAASACVHEFAESWTEFAIVAPGAIERHGVTFKNLTALVERLAGSLRVNGG